MSHKVLRALKGTKQKQAKGGEGGKEGEKRRTTAARDKSYGTLQRGFCCWFCYGQLSPPPRLFLGNPNGEGTEGSPATAKRKEAAERRGGRRPVEGRIKKEGREHREDWRDPGERKVPKLAAEGTAEAAARTGGGGPLTYLLSLRPADIEPHFGSPFSSPAVFWWY